jgi:hypothetical protein
METPLIHTSKGNLPLDSLIEKVVWTDNEEETICAVEHWLGEECVRRQVNIMKRKGNSVLGAIGQL